MGDTNGLIGLLDIPTDRLSDWRSFGFGLPTSNRGGEMNTQRLIHDRQITAGEHVRIWQERNGRFLFEHLRPTGKWVTIACDSIEEAISLWRQVEKKDLPIPFVERGRIRVEDTSKGEERR